MTVDDLTTPLGRGPARRRREPFVSIPKVIAVALALFLGAFVVWAFVSDDPFGGEPKVAVPIDERGLAAANKPDAAGPPSATTVTDGAPPASNVKTVSPGVPPSEFTKPSGPAAGKQNRHDYRRQNGAAA